MTLDLLSPTLVPSYITGGIAALAILSSWLIALKSAKDAKEERWQAREDAREERKLQAELDDVNHRIRELQDHMRSVLAIDFNGTEEPRQVIRQINQAGAAVASMDVSHNYRRACAALLTLSKTEEDIERERSSGTILTDRMNLVQNYSRTYDREAEELLARRKELTGY